MKYIHNVNPRKMFYPDFTKKKNGRLKLIVSQEQFSYNYEQS